MIIANKFVRAQYDYCILKDLPIFIPEDGRCWACFGDIFRPPNGFTLLEASRTLITNCPYCGTSFCD